jgi:hypothetical protein
MGLPSPEALRREVAFKREEAARFEPVQPRKKPRKKPQQRTRSGRLPDGRLRATKHLYSRIEELWS